MLSHTVCKWVHHFCDEKCTNVHDKEREGQLKKVTNEETKNAVVTHSRR